MPPEDDVSLAVAQATAGLVNKNNELLGEVKTLKSKLKDFESLDIESLKGAAATLKSQESEALEKKGEYDKIINQMKEDHAKEISKRDELLAAERTHTRGIIVNSALQSALASAQVDPVMMEAATDMLSSKVAVTEKDGVRSANIGDKSVKDWVTEWSKTEVGKRFVLADTSSGASEPRVTSNGSASSTISKGDWDKKFDPDSIEYNMMDQALLLDENPELYNSLVKKYQEAVKKKRMGGFYRG